MTSPGPPLRQPPLSFPHCHPFPQSTISSSCSPVNPILRQIHSLPRTETPPSPAILFLWCKSDMQDVPSEMPNALDPGPLFPPRPPPDRSINIECAHIERSSRSQKKGHPDESSSPVADALIRPLPTWPPGAPPSDVSTWHGASLGREHTEAGNDQAVVSLLPPGFFHSSKLDHTKSPSWRSLNFPLSIVLFFFPPPVLQTLFCPAPELLPSGNIPQSFPTYSLFFFV